MALVTRVAPSFDTSTGMFAPQITGLIAGQNLNILSPCYIRTADGFVYMSTAAADNEAAEVVGFNTRAAVAGQPVTLIGYGARCRYGAGLAVGSRLYVGAAAGTLDDAPQVGDPFGVADVISATDIRVTRSAHVAHLGVNLRISTVAGAGAGVPIAVAGIAVGDMLVSCWQFTTAAAIATLTNVTATTTIGAGTVTIVGDTTGDTVVVFWYDLT